MMPHTNIKISPIAGALGADVSGVTLDSFRNEETWKQIYDAFTKYKVLAFRDLEIDNDGMMEICSRFGQPSYYYFVEGMPDHPFIHEIIKEPHETKNYGGGWHFDTPYIPDPPIATMLYCLECPEYGGDTMFANTISAYRALSPGMKLMLAPLKCVHNAGLKGLGGRSAHYDSNFGSMKTQNIEISDEIESIHPLIQTHWVTKEKYLYVSRTHTTKIAGMTEYESRPIIEYLQFHITKPEFTCRLRWTPNTLAIWDNLLLQHFPINDYHGHRRHMRRLAVGRIGES